MTDAQAQEMISTLSAIQSILGSRVSSIGDERMPSTQVFQRVEEVANRFYSVVTDLREVVITRHDAQVTAGKLTLIHEELKKHTLILESICAKLHEPPAPKKKAR